jgi:hypothetical protein
VTRHTESHGESTARHSLLIEFLLVVDSDSEVGGGAPETEEMVTELGPM